MCMHCVRIFICRGTALEYSRKAQENVSRFLFVQSPRSCEVLTCKCLSGSGRKRTFELVNTGFKKLQLSVAIWYYFLGLVEY